MRGPTAESTIRRWVMLAGCDSGTHDVGHLAARVGAVSDQVSEERVGAGMCGWTAVRRGEHAEGSGTTLRVKCDEHVLARRRDVDRHARWQWLVAADSTERHPTDRHPSEDETGDHVPRHVDE